MASKPNLLSFAVAVGYHENKTVLEFENLMATDPAFTVSIPLHKLAGDIFQMLMSHASLNQSDGDYSTYTDEMFHQLVFGPKFLARGLPSLTVETVAKMVAWLKRTFLDKDGRIIGWKDYQPHIHKHKQNIRNKRKGGTNSGKSRKAKSQQTSEYGTNPKKQALKDYEVAWDGKVYTETSLRKIVDDLEREVQKKERALKKSKDKLDDAHSDPTRYAELMAAHNIWLAELTATDKTLASAQSALLRTKIEPPVRRKPEPPEPKAGPSRLDPDAHSKAIKEMARKAREEMANA